MSLGFVTSHYSLSYPRSLPPIHVEVGGALPEKIDPLPKDMGDFIGKDDFIYISLGSAIEFTGFPEDIQRQFIDAIAAFPEMKFVWKEEQEMKLPTPKHIKLVKRAPQISLLSHSKIKGFITHSGLGSSYHGVDILWSSTCNASTVR